MHLRFSLRSPRTLAVSCLAGLAVAFLTASSASARRYAGYCPKDYLCLFDHADYDEGLTATEDAAHMYWISGFRRPVHDDLRDGYLAPVSITGQAAGRTTPTWNGAPSTASGCCGP